MSRQVISQVQSEKLILDRRERIIKAAIAVFRRSGFHVATTKDIANEAGLTQSNLYNYISSKQDVLFLVCEHLVGLYQEAVDGAIASHVDAHARLIEAFQAVIGVISSHSDEVQLLYNETHALEKKDRIIILTSISKLINSFDLLLKDYEEVYGPCLLKNRRLAANFFTFVPAIIALRYWDLGSHARREEVETAILEFTLAGLGIPLSLPPVARTGK
jgi:AcrR family transcriptional regulator